ncbi:hypothetical protein BU16DRAFT_558153 [Lophium mytilinum]|uniref:Uncharacterized protein n=1 Tax=Lophium mytilinum TaxID=390894 RepID=A0A6A6R514_9PEZI|nr:hypothetical protein BU16DRAFT_558153 [Lophium mytilinum]
MSVSSASAKPDSPHTTKRKLDENSIVCFSNKKNKMSEDIKSVSEISVEAELVTPFRFLDLPRELRDMVYEYAFQPLSESNYTRGPVIFNKPHPTSFLHPPKSFHGPLKNLALLGTCKQVKEETQEALYRKYYFWVGFSYRYRIRPPSKRPPTLRHFDVPETYFPSLSSCPPACADPSRMINHQWDITHIRMLILTFECTANALGGSLWEEYEPLWDFEDPDNNSVAYPCRFRALHYMPSLKEVRILIQYSDNTYGALRRFLKGEVKEAPDTLKQMMRSLISAVPKGVEIMWGITGAEASKLFTHFWQYWQPDREKALGWYEFALASWKVLKGVVDEAGDGVVRTDAEVFVKGHSTGTGVGVGADELEDSECSGDSGVSKDADISQSSIVSQNFDVSENFTGSDAEAE